MPKASAYNNIRTLVDAQRTLRNEQSYNALPSATVIGAIAFKNDLISLRLASAKIVKYTTGDTFAWSNNNPDIIREYHLAEVLQVANDSANNARCNNTCSSVCGRSCTPLLSPVNGSLIIFELGIGCLIPGI